MEILCDGTPVRIEMLNSVVYAVIPNGASYFEKEEWETDPFGEPFSQSYRYTPFQVKVTDLSYEGRQYPVYALLYLDGSRADTKHILDKTHIFKGFRTNEGVTQFCFSPPRVGNANSREGKRRHLHPSLPAPAPSLRIALTCKNVKLRVHVCCRRHSRPPCPTNAPSTIQPSPNVCAHLLVAAHAFAPQLLKPQAVTLMLFSQTRGSSLSIWSLAVSASRRMKHT